MGIRCELVYEGRGHGPSDPRFDKRSWECGEYIITLTHGVVADFRYSIFIVRKGTQVWSKHGNSYQPLYTAAKHHIEFDLDPVPMDEWAKDAEKWTPTPANINALPRNVRRYVHELETICDPAGEVAAISLIRDQNVMLQEQLRTERKKRMRLLGKVRFVDLDIGAVFLKDGSLWVRTDYDAATSIPRLLYGTCNFMQNVEDEWVIGIDQQSLAELLPELGATHGI